jgi:hypothetical protein
MHSDPGVLQLSLPFDAIVGHRRSRGVVFRSSVVLGLVQQLTHTRNSTIRARPPFASCNHPIAASHCGRTLEHRRHQVSRRDPVHQRGSLKRNASLFSTSCALYKPAAQVRGRGCLWKTCVHFGGALPSSAEYELIHINIFRPLRSRRAAASAAPAAYVRSEYRAPSGGNGRNRLIHP